MLEMLLEWEYHPNNSWQCDALNSSSPQIEELGLEMMGKTSLRISLTTKVVFQPNSWQGRFVSWIQYWESLTHRESLEFGGLMGN